MNAQAVNNPVPVSSAYHLLGGLFDDQWEDRWWPRPLAPAEREGAMLNAAMYLGDTWRASRAALSGSDSQAAMRGTTAAARTRSAMMSGVRKLVCTKSPSVWPKASLRSTMMAVWGMGRRSGRRKSAVTANQSASPPTRPAAAVASRYPTAPASLSHTCSAT